MSITTQEEYYQELYRIQDENFPVNAVLLPSDERIYKVNLNNRTVEVPEYLSVVKDHKAETVYFEMDRFLDYMDLTNLTCVIQYVNADNKSFYYPVPFYDVTTRSGYDEQGNWKDKLLIPWVIDGNATVKKGPVMFSIRFYRIDPANRQFVYNLTTKPAKGQVLHGMDKTIFNPEEYEEAGKSLYLALEQEFADIKKKAIEKLYWIIAE